MSQQSQCADSGMYVLATKYIDGDPGDHFCVGFVRGKTWHDRFDVVDGNGRLVRHNGFRRVEAITRSEGDWLVAHVHEIEALGISLWDHLKWLRLTNCGRGTVRDNPKETR